MILRGGSEYPAAPKYARFERERRWLVDAVRCVLPPHFVLIEDRYIDGTRLRLWRMTDSATGRAALKLTKKYGSDDPMARPIVTVYLTEEEYEVFAALPGRYLIKRRHLIDEFSVDAFQEDLAPLVIAEIEQPCASSLRAVVPPPWAVREVTGDAAFECGNLV